MSRKLLIRTLKILISLGIFILAAYLIRQMLHKYNFSEILDHITSLSIKAIAIALILTIVNYIILFFYDYLGVIYTKNKLPLKTIAFAACTSYSISHSLGFSSVLGAGIRYRIYSSAGLKIIDITKIVLMCGLSFGLGYITVLGLALIFEPKITMEMTGLDDIYFKLVGALIIFSIVIYLIITKIAKTEFRFFGHSFALPSVNITLLQIISGTADVFVAASVLYVVMPGAVPGGYLEFLGIYVIAILIATATNVPGGLGVFESIILVFYSGQIEPPEILAGLLAFRGIYFILPLIIGLVGFSIFEIAFLRKKLRSALNIQQKANNL